MKKLPKPTKSPYIVLKVNKGPFRYISSTTHCNAQRGVAHTAPPHIADAHVCGARTWALWQRQANVHGESYSFLWVHQTQQYVPY